MYFVNILYTQLQFYSLKVYLQLSTSQPADDQANMSTQISALMLAENKPLLLKRF